MTPWFLFEIVSVLLVIDFFVVNWSAFVAFGDALDPSRPKSRVPATIGFYIFSTSLISFFILLILWVAAGAAVFLAN